MEPRPPSAPVHRLEQPRAHVLVVPASLQRERELLATMIAVVHAAFHSRYCRWPCEYDLQGNTINALPLELFPCFDSMLDGVKLHEPGTGALTYQHAAFWRGQALARSQTETDG